MAKYDKEEQVIKSSIPTNCPYCKSAYIKTDINKNYMEYKLELYTKCNTCFKKFIEEIPLLEIE